MGLELRKWLLSLLGTIAIAFSANYWATSIEIASLRENTNHQSTLINSNTKHIEDLTETVHVLSQELAASNARVDESKKVLTKLDATVDKLSDVVSRLDERTKIQSN